LAVERGAVTTLRAVCEGDQRDGGWVESKERDAR